MRRTAPAASLESWIRDAGPPPPKDAPATAWKNHAERLSRNLARGVADALRARFPGVRPDAQGRGHESKARGAAGPKKLDVNYSTPELGLALGVSIKTINKRDRKSGRFTKNFTRVDGELRAEATDYHRRQPYAMLVALVFLPREACDDATAREPSSFGAAVRAFRPRNHRVRPQDELDAFEKVFVAVYAPDAPADGSTVFFDVEQAPPRSGPPAGEHALGFDAALRAIATFYDERNDPPFRFAGDPEGR